MTRDPKTILSTYNSACARHFRLIKKPLMFVSPRNCPEPRIRRCLLAALLAGWVLVAAPQAARAQGVGPSVGGFVTGATAGTVVSAGIMALAAQSEVYLWNPHDLMGSMGIPIAVGALGGGIQGAVASDRLRPAVLLSATAGLAGVGLGYFLGREVWDDGQNGWAGALIGGGAGALAGWLIGTAISGSTSEAIPSTSVTLVAIPLGGGR